MELSQIYQTVQPELERVKGELKSISKVDFPWLSRQLGYVVRGSGKAMRPALTLLAGKLHRYHTQYLLPMAVSVELMHTATLVHDDAIDKSVVRRGQPTINKLFGEDIAVLMGDYLFAKAGEFVSDTQNPRVIKLFSQTLAIISSGEINQFLGSFQADQTRQQYIHRIASKTASLFSLATQSGAILSEAPEEAVTVLRDYGYNLGIAFQVVDDILDFVGSEEALGKPVGSDLTQGTLTLPAMLLLERQPGEDNPVRRYLQQREKQNLAAAIAAVRSSSVIDESRRIAGEYCSRACDKFSQLPDSPSRRALAELCDYVINQQL